MPHARATAEPRQSGRTKVVEGSVETRKGPRHQILREIDFDPVLEGRRSAQTSIDAFKKALEQTRAAAT
jgi:hypothetical protein